MNSTVKTFIFMAGLTALFMVAGQALGGESGMVLALLLALGMNFFAYWYSDRMALTMARAREVSPTEAPQAPGLYNCQSHAQRLCHRSQSGTCGRGGYPRIAQSVAPG